MNREERYMVQYSIEDVLVILDSAPIKQDLVDEINLAQLANRIPIAHLSIEKGLKTLISKAKGKPDDIHVLGKLYGHLKSRDPSTAEFLSVAFDDAVKCFDINTRFKQFNHLGSIDQYLSKVGTKNVFDRLRYWSLGIYDRKDTPFQLIVFPIHREILYAILCVLEDGKSSPETVSNRIETAVKHAMCSDLMWGAEETEKEKSINWYTTWIPTNASFREAIKKAVHANFDIKPGDEFVTNILRNAVDELQKSKDAAIRHFATALLYIKRDSQAEPDVFPEVDWWNKSHNKGEVKTPGDTHLGFIEQYADKSWGINSNDGFSGVSDISESLKDAKYYLVNHLTERVVFEVNGEEKYLRIVKKQIYERDGASYSDEIRPLERMHDLELWDNNHGFNPGDKIIVGLPFKGEERTIRYILTGKVEEVTGPKVSVLGTGEHGFSPETEDDDADTVE